MIAEKTLDLVGQPHLYEVGDEGCDESSDVPEILTEGPSVPYFEAKLEYLEAKAELAKLRGFIALGETQKGREKLLKQYGSQERYEQVMRGARRKVQELPSQIHQATAKLIGSDALKIMGKSEESIEDLRLVAVIGLEERYGKGKEKEREKAANKLRKIVR